MNRVRTMMILILAACLAAAASLARPACPSGGTNAQWTLNPGSQWYPVIAQLTLDEPRVAAGGDPGPPFVKVDAPSPGVTAAWKTLEGLIGIKRRAYYEDEPVISGWQVWSDPVRPGISGLEVKRSDRAGGNIPMIAPERGRDIPVRLRIEIWGRYRLPDRPDLLPGDAEYQRLVKKKIRVTDFSLTVHVIEGKFSAASIKNAAAAEPLKVIGALRGLDDSLAAVEAQTYAVPGNPDYLGELRLEMKLRFPEEEGRVDTAYETALEGCLRFFCGSRVSIRVISDEIRTIK